MLSEERIAGITARVQAATEGPWNWYGQGHTNADRDDCPIYEALYSGDEWVLNCGIMQEGTIHYGVLDVRQVDADFITAARQDIPDLLTERAELLAQIDELESALSEAMADGRDDGERFRQVGPRVPR